MDIISIAVTLKEQKLRDAAQRGDIREVARLIKSGVSVNSSGEVRAIRACTCI